MLGVDNKWFVSLGDYLGQQRREQLELERYQERLDREAREEGALPQEQQVKEEDEEFQGMRPIRQPQQPIQPEFPSFVPSTSCLPQQEQPTQESQEERLQRQRQGQQTRSDLGISLVEQQLEECQLAAYWEMFDKWARR